jgi:hypothetical protein
MAAYVFDAVSVHPERMVVSRQGAASVKAFDRLIAATNNIDCRGATGIRTNVMLEFPSMEKAGLVWLSGVPKFLPIRLDANRDKMVIFEGLP